MTQSDYWYACRILSYDPLITISLNQNHQTLIPILAAELPQIFDRPVGLHFIIPTWHSEGTGPARLRRSFEQASIALPGHQLIMLASTDYEAHLLALEGVPTVLGNPSIFADEAVWHPSNDRVPGLGRFDAVYNGRLEDVKRHSLASRIPHLLLLYAYNLAGSMKDAVDRMRQVMPNACFANHDLNNGDYAYLPARRLVQLTAHAEVGLCLSAEEGHTRASIEYMLCGLPVVSTPSIGGRDRYYVESYCKVVPSDPDAVADAVLRLSQQCYSREQVRVPTLRMLRFDRVRFLECISRVVQKQLGISNAFTSIRPFIGIAHETKRHSEVVQQLRQDHRVIVQR